MDVAALPCATCPGTVSVHIGDCFLARTYHCPECGMIPRHSGHDGGCYAWKVLWFYCDHRFCWNGRSLMCFRCKRVFGRR